MRVSSAVLIIALCVGIISSSDACREFLKNIARRRISNYLTAFPELTDEIKNGQLGPRQRYGMFNNDNNNNNNNGMNNNGLPNNNMPNGNNQQSPNSNLQPNNNQPQPNNNQRNPQQPNLNNQPSNQPSGRGETTNEIPSIPDANRVTPAIN